MEANQRTGQVLTDFFLLCTAIPIILLIIAAIYTQVILPCFKEASFIKREMDRSISDAEYKLWKRKLKRLYVRKIPIIGRFLARLIKH